MFVEAPAIVVAVAVVLAAAAAAVLVSGFAPVVVLVVGAVGASGPSIAEPSPCSNSQHWPLPCGQRSWGSCGVGWKIVAILAACFAPPFAVVAYTPPASSSLPLASSGPPPTSLGAKTVDLRRFPARPMALRATSSC